MALLYVLTAVAASAEDTIARAILPNETAIDHTALTEHERVRAELWGLADDEWRRYQSLMAGIRGSISPDMISPIEVLGIHARDAAERRKYAEQWAIMLREDAE
ncbi:MAG: TIGR03759 family integrating conjugative element protein, partial [Gammaproteobacteria bacterium]